MPHFSRRQFTRFAVAGACGLALPRLSQAQTAQEKTVPWLREIQTKPATVPPLAKPLASLLAGEAGKPITTLDGWKLRREALRKAWLEFLCPFPAERKVPPALKVLEEDRPEGLIRQRVEYEVEPGLKTEGYLIRPADAREKAPGVVVFHSTVDYSIEQPAGLKGPPEKHFGLSLARRGWTTFSPRCYAWPTNSRLAAKEEAASYLARKPGSKGMTKMLYDALVAVDILAAEPQVDSSRLGAVGHSLGAKEVLYLAAFDERIKATVSSEGGVGIKFSNWNASWYLGAEVDEPSFAREHHELLALTAPRAFLLVGGQSADGDQGWPFIEAALPVYKLYGEPARIGQYNHRQGHAVPPAAEARIAEWLATYL